MHLRLCCMHEHFDLITNPFKYKFEISQIFIHPFQKIGVNAKCNSWIVDLNNIQIKRFNLCANVNSSKDVKKFINAFKYKYEASNFYVCFSIF
jgi:hypothetical protein